MTALVRPMHGRCPVCGSRLRLLARAGAMVTVCEDCADVDPEGVRWASHVARTHPNASLDELRAMVPPWWSGEATRAWREARGVVS